MPLTLAEELAEARAKLARLEAEYKEFSYIVSHDLSGPLRTIEGFATIISQKHADSFDEKTKLHFQYIVNGVKNGTEILTSLKAFSRLNTRAQPFSACDCNALVADVQENLAEVIQSTAAQVESANLPMVFADSVQLSQAFYHLLENALRYHRADSPPKVRITAEDLGAHWQFIVTDNGIGVPAKLAERIFKPLRRAVKDKDYPGMGMGLAVTKKIAERHRGDLQFESTEGAGSTFRMTIAKGLTND